MKYLSKITTVVILLAVGLSFIALGMVSAAEDRENEYENGTYKIQLQVFKAKEKKESMMQKFIKEDETFVSIQNGQAKVTLTLTHANVIKSFLVDNGTEKVEVEVIDENKTDNEHTVLFEVENLAKIIDGEVTIDVPIFSGELTNDVRLQFDVSAIET